MLRSQSRGPEISLPRTLRSPPDLTVSIRSSSSNISAITPRRSSAIPLHDLLALGRQNPDDSSEPFNMAYLAIRGSGAVNGVSRAARAGEPAYFSASVSALAAGRSSDRLCDQRRSCADLGFPGGGCALDHSLRQEPVAGERTVEDDIRRSPTRSCGRCARQGEEDADWQYARSASRVSLPQRGEIVGADRHL